MGRRHSTISKGIAINIGTMFVRLSADISGVERNMAAVRKSFSEVGHAAEKMGRALAIGVTAPLAALGALSVRSAVQLDSLKRGLTSVAGSSAEAEKQLGRLAEIAKLPGLGFREAIQGSIRLQAAGFSASLAEDALRGFANALATVGGSQADLDRVTRALSQIAAKGKVSAEEINQLAETIPQIRVVMKDAFGTANTEELQKLGIEAETFIKKVTDSLLKLEQVTGGPQKAFEDLQDAVFRASAALGERLLPVVLPIVEGLARMLEQMRGLNPDTVKWAIAIAGVAAVMGPLLIVVGSMTTAVSTLATAIGVGLLPLIGVGGGIVIALTALGALFLKNKQDALEAAGAVEDLTASYKGLSRSAAEFELGEAIRRQADLRARIASTPSTVQRKSQTGAPISIELDNPALKALNAEYELANEHVRVLSRRISELAFGTGETSGAMTGAATSAGEAADRLEAFGREVEQVRGKMEWMADWQRYLLNNSTLPTLGKDGIIPGRIGAADRIYLDRLETFRRNQGRGLSLDPATMSKGARTPYSIVAEQSETLASKLSGLASQITGLSAGALGPLAVAAIALKPVFDGFRESLGPTLEKLSAPLNEIGRIVGNILAPVLTVLVEPLRAISQNIGSLLEPLRLLAFITTELIFPFERLAPVIELIGKAFSYVNSAIGHLLRGIGNLLNKLPGSIGNPLKELGQSMIDNAEAFRRGERIFGQAVAGMVDTISFGIPEGFRVLNLQQAKFDSSRAVASSALSGISGSNPVSVSDHRVTTIHVTQQAGEDGEGFARKVVEIMYRQNRRDGLTYFGNPYAINPSAG